MYGLNIIFLSIQGATGTVTKSYGRFSVTRAEITAFQKPIGSLEQHHNEKADFLVTVTSGATI